MSHVRTTRDAMSSVPSRCMSCGNEMNAIIKFWLIVYCRCAVVFCAMIGMADAVPMAVMTDSITVVVDSSSDGSNIAGNVYDFLKPSPLILGAQTNDEFDIMQAFRVNPITIERSPLSVGAREGQERVVKNKDADDGYQALSEYQIVDNAAGEGLATLDNLLKAHVAVRLQQDKAASKSPAGTPRGLIDMEASRILPTMLDQFFVDLLSENTLESLGLDNFNLMFMEMPDRSYALFGNLFAQSFFFSWSNPFRAADQYVFDHYNQDQAKISSSAANRVSQESKLSLVDFILYVCKETIRNPISYLIVIGLILARVAFLVWRQMTQKKLAAQTG